MSPLGVAVKVTMTASWSLSKRCWRRQAQKRQPGFLHVALDGFTRYQVLAGLALLHVGILLLFQWQVPDAYMVSGPKWGV